jgi:hypothetical protein
MYVIEDAICPISSKRIVCEGVCAGIVAGKEKAEIDAKHKTNAKQEFLNVLLERVT